MHREPRARGPRFRIARASALATFAALLLLGGTAEAGAQDACAEPRSAKLEGWSVTVRPSGPAKAEPRATCVRNVLVIKPVSDAATAGLLGRRKPGSLFPVHRD